MGQQAIQEKLVDFLDRNQPFTGESQAVYLLVEIRKLLDRNEDQDFHLLRFYCDWSVHTAKDKITSAIREIMEDVFEHRHPIEIQGAYLHLNTTLGDFSIMQQLKMEMENFLVKYTLPTTLVANENWPKFIHMLVNVLADQPINRPCNGIVSFSFKPSPFGAVLGQIVYDEGTIEPTVQDYASVY